MKLDFNDILIVPAEQSEIRSRKEINPFIYKNYLPLFTAPMDTVVSEDNIKAYEWNAIGVVLPRGLKSDDVNDFKSYSFDEFKKLTSVNVLLKGDSYNIDIANGHMSELVNVVKKVKKDNPHICLMVGNVANPKTYEQLSNAGADLIRIGIGNGGGCFIENTVITTKLGDKLIKDIEIGDCVLTHTGEYKEVLSVIAYPSREEIIKINDTISTKTHEYYVLNKKYIDIVDDDNICNYAEWIKAENLTNDFFLLEYEVND